MLVETGAMAQVKELIDISLYVSRNASLNISPVITSVIFVFIREIAVKR